MSLLTETKVTMLGIAKADMKAPLSPTIIEQHMYHALARFASPEAVREIYDLGFIRQHLESHNLEAHWER